MRCVMRSTAICCVATPSLTSRTYSVSTSATIPAGQLKAGTRLGADSWGSAVRSRAATSFFTGVGGHASELCARTLNRLVKGERGRREELGQSKGSRNEVPGPPLRPITVPLVPCAFFFRRTKVCGGGSDDYLRHDACGEEFLRLHVPVGDALLIGVERHLLPRGPVFLDAVRKEIAAEEIAHAASVGCEPRHRIARYCRVENTLDRAPLRFQKCVVQVARRPGMPLHNRSLHRDDVHDGPHVGPPVVRLFHLDVLGEEPQDIGMSFEKAGWWTRDDRTVDLVRREQLAQALIRNPRDRHARWQVQFDL